MSIPLCPRLSEKRLLTLPFAGQRQRLTFPCTGAGRRLGRFTTFFLGTTGWAFFIVFFGFFTDKYEAWFWWYEVFEMFRKLLLTSLGAVLAPGDKPFSQVPLTFTDRAAVMPTQRTCRVVSDLHQDRSFLLVFHSVCALLAVRRDGGGLHERFHAALHTDLAHVRVVHPDR